MYIGHKSADGRIQLLKEHLTNVSKKAQQFAAPFGGGNHAARTALLHDAGKYSAAGQRRMSDPEHTAKVDHATAGAKIALEQCRDAYGAVAIAGHHGGMSNLGNRMSGEGSGTLYGRVRKDLTGIYDAGAFWTENEIEKDNRKIISEWLLKERTPFSHSFYTRMLFSCLVDADYLDTEEFMRRGESLNELRGQYASLDELELYLDQALAALKSKPKNAINDKRNIILDDCVHAAGGKPGLYSLTVPTGGGKTISSLAFAIKHAKENRMKRIIYVIPYTSIIEQNAKVFRGILGDENIIEHHSGIQAEETKSKQDAEKEDMEGNETFRKKLLAAENWDAPVIVTTSVQFFDSLFSNKPSKCRKLHNIADSVIIFDEAQMIPLAYLNPCVWAIGELVRHYHATAVLCTATQPSLNRLFSDYDKDLIIHEICHNVAELQTFFRRVHFEDKGGLDVSSVAEAMSRQNQVLCIVNKKKSAQEIFKKLPKGSYHLSTWMTPDHRTKILEEIRDKLDKGQTCRLISTSLMEAGVDVDFPQVWREKAGLDSILQAAGRCNREGKHTADESKVVLFTMECGVPKYIQSNLTASEIALEGAACPDESATIETYFNQLYRMNGEKGLDVKNILDLCRICAFESIAEDFHLIDSDTYTIYIPTEQNADDLELLKSGNYSRALMRRLGRSAVNVYKWDFEKLSAAGKLLRLDEYSAVLLDKERNYDDLCGLKLDSETGIGLFEE